MVREFSRVDRAAWFDIETSRRRLVPRKVESSTRLGALKPRERGLCGLVRDAATSAAGATGRAERHDDISALRCVAARIATPRSD